jgi:hypothetical protein
VCGGLAVALGGAATVIWQVWIIRYVERHGEEAAMRLLVCWGSVIDYRKAWDIARRLGQRPWFVTWYGRIMAAAILCFLAALAALVLA